MARHTTRKAGYEARLETIRRREMRRSTGKHQLTRAGR